MKKIQIGIGLAILAAIIVIALIFSSKGKEEVKDQPTKTIFLKEADKLFRQGKYSEAKEKYKEALEQAEAVDAFATIQEKLEKTNMNIIFSPILTECTTTYVVKPKDALVKIAKKYKTTVNLIKRANGLKSDTIRPGQELKVNTCPFSIVVDKSQNLLFLKREGEVIKTYLVSTGASNGTPTGTFKIVNKLVKPTWFKTGAVIPPDSPENILGSRWMGFDLEGYGIHGTTDPDNLGKQITLGCVRMRNSAVEELFDIVPVATEVTIID